VNVDPYRLKFFVVSDPHLTYPTKSPERLSQDSIRLLNETIDEIEFEGADLVLFTGDIMEAREFALKNLKIAFNALSRLTIPWLVIMGNHDIPYRSTKDGYRKSDFIHRFSGHGPKDTAAYWRHDCAGKKITFIGLDTTTQTSSSGAIGLKQQEWLEQILSGIDDDRHVVLLTHHPFIVFDPEIEEITDMDIFVLDNHREIRDIIQRHNCVKLVISGHNHTCRLIQENGITYIGCPSINTWPAKFSRFLLRRGNVEFAHQKIRDQEKNLEIKQMILGSESPWVPILGNTEAVEDYFTRGPQQGQCALQ
jgi:DNA repair exonuclease SbcCD nuclease subunit